MTNHPRRAGRRKHQRRADSAHRFLDICQYCRGVAGHHAPVCDADLWQLLGDRVWIAPAGTPAPTSRSLR